MSAPIIENNNFLFPDRNAWLCTMYMYIHLTTVFAGVKAAPPYRPHPQLWHFVEEKKKKKKRERKKKRTKQNDRNFLVEHSFFFTNYTKFINILINQQEVNLKNYHNLADLHRLLS